MDIAFYFCSAVAIVATLGVITGRHAVHALLYLIVSLIAVVALLFVTLGAPFVAALEVIVYAGAIIVLFIFVVILTNVTPETIRREEGWLGPVVWIGPGILGVVLLVGLAAILFSRQTALAGTVVDPQAVGIALFRNYTVGVELASTLLLAALVGAYHLGQRATAEEEEVPETEELLEYVEETTPPASEPALPTSARQS